MTFVKISSGNYGISTADTVLIFKKNDILFSSLTLEILLIDTILALVNTAAASKNSVDILLRDSKSGVLFRLRLCNDLLLFFFGWKAYA